MRQLDPIEIEPDAWCLWCGDPLPEPEERHHGRRYCCKRCKWAAENDTRSQQTKAARPMRACLWCGTEFLAWPSHKQHCSPKCSERTFNARKSARRRG